MLEIHRCCCVYIFNEGDDERRSGLFKSSLGGEMRVGWRNYSQMKRITGDEANDPRLVLGSDESGVEKQGRVVEGGMRTYM